jgi:hypothetical protein
MHLLCWAAHIHWRPKFGYIFIWRLNFLSRVPLGSRDQFLAAAASKCHLPETRLLLVKLAERFRQNQVWETTAFVGESRASFFVQGGKFQGEKLILQLQ